MPSEPPTLPPQLPPDSRPPPLPVTAPPGSSTTLVVCLVTGGVFVLLLFVGAVFWLSYPLDHTGQPAAQYPLPPPPPLSPQEARIKPQLRMGDGRLANFLLAPVEEAIAQAPCTHRDGLPDFPLLSPAGTTRVRNPLLILRHPDDASSLLTVRRLPGRQVVSSVSGIGGAQQSLPLSAGDYEVEVQPAAGGEVFCRGTFTVPPGGVDVDSDIDDARLLTEARAELETDTPNPSDALQWLERLSWQASQSGVALRLRLHALGSLGYETEWQETCRQLRSQAAGTGS